MLRLPSFWRECPSRAGLDGRITSCHRSRSHAKTAIWRAWVDKVDSGIPTAIAENVGVSRNQQGTRTKENREFRVLFGAQAEGSLMPEDSPGYSVTTITL
ncbi:hypothetical protein FOPE_09172 [Fonsecaea pedrosoi]|nr:hypothetical protein FOPE_09172 [Fonsecaea pedrosoi]